MVRPLEDLGEDLTLMANCVRNEPDKDDAHFKRVEGGFVNEKPFLPIYFQDGDYRQRKHAVLAAKVAEDAERSAGR